MSGLLTLQQAATFLQICPDELRALVKRREIASVPGFTMSVLWRARQRLRDQRLAQDQFDALEARHSRAQE